MTTMRRLLHHLFTFLCGLSILLFIATIVFWVRSYQLTEIVSWKNAHGARAIYSARGHLMLDVFFIDWSAHPAEFQRLRYVKDEPRLPLNYIPALNFDRGDIDIEWQWGGFSWWQRRNAVTRRNLILAAFPFWSIALATAALPLAIAALMIRSRLRRRRLRRAGLCEQCGYDLRATQVGNACPECGQAKE